MDRDTKLDLLLNKRYQFQNKIEAATIDLAYYETKRNGCDLTFKDLYDIQLEYICSLQYVLDFINQKITAL